MNELNDLIERLYNEGITQGGLPQQSAPSAMPQSASTETDTLVTRLLQVLDQMGALLQRQDQPDMQIVAPDQAALLRILNHWEQMMSGAEGLRLHMQSLEQDIVKMQPWGNFDVMKVEQLASQGCHIRFWQMPTHLLALRVADGSWEDCHMQVISQDTELAYFVTVSMGNQAVSMPAEAHEVEICPCPVSTLIMLQTRDKDSLRKLDTLMGDYALCHYGEVYNALRQALPQGANIPHLYNERMSLRQRLHMLWRKG